MDRAVVVMLALCAGGGTVFAENWDAAGGGDFNDPGNWASGVVPGYGPSSYFLDDVRIDPSFGGRVFLNEGSIEIDTLDVRSSGSVTEFRVGTNAAVAIGGGFSISNSGSVSGEGILVGASDANVWGLLDQSDGLGVFCESLLNSGQIICGGEFDGDLTNSGRVDAFDVDHRFGQGMQNTQEGRFVLRDAFVDLGIGELHNEGELLSGGGDIVGDVVNTGEGVISVNSDGLLNIIGNMTTDGGTIGIGPGSAVVVWGDFDGDPSFLGSGSLDIGGTYDGPGSRSLAIGGDVSFASGLTFDVRPGAIGAVHAAGVVRVAGPLHLSISTQFDLSEELVIDLITAGALVGAFSGTPDLLPLWRLEQTETALRLIAPADCVGDITTTNKRFSLVPDGVVDGADLSRFVEAWLFQDPGPADIHSSNTNPGDAAYGSPDGAVDGADLSYFVEQWLAGCP